MKNVLLTTLVVLVLALVVAIIYCVDITKDRDVLNTILGLTQTNLDLTQSELSSTELKLDLAKQTLDSTQTELGITKQTLTTVEDELKDKKDELEDTQGELEEAQDKLEDTQDKLEDTQDKLEDTQDKLEDTRGELEDIQDELEVAQGTLAGLGITIYESKECYDAELIDNPSATNPTWSQLMTFLSRDKTEKNTFIEGVYDCSEFSRDVHNNAEAAGIRAAVVHVDFRYESIGHALNAFLTTDYGLVYVDCTEAPDDMFARVKAGKEYRAVEIVTFGHWYTTGTNVRNDYWWDSLRSYYYMPSSTGGHSVTSSIEIYW